MTIVHLLQIAALFLAVSLFVSAALFATLVGLARLEMAAVPAIRGRGLQRRGPG